MGWKDAPLVTAPAASWKDAPVVDEPARPEPPREVLHGKRLARSERKFDPIDRPNYQPLTGLAAPLIEIGDTPAERKRLARQDAEAKAFAAKPREVTMQGHLADGTADRVGINITKAAKTFTAGLLRTGAAGIDTLAERSTAAPGSDLGLAALAAALPSTVTTAMRNKARSMEGYASMPVQGETNWDNVHSIGDAGQFLLEQGPGSVATMPLLANPVGMGIYGASLTGNIGQQRALADGRADATAADLVTAAPFAAASTAMERLGLETVLSKALPGNIVGRVATAAGAEGGTEFGQGYVESIGGGVGTENGVDWQNANDNALSGALLGSILGGATHGGAELVHARTGTPAPVDQVAPEPAALPAPDVAPIVQPVAEPAPVASSWQDAPVIEPVPVTQPMPAEPPEEITPKASDPAALQPKATPEEITQSPPAEPAALRPEPGDLAEGERLVRTPGGGSVRTRMEVVDASALKQAEGDNQNRDRSRETTDLQVQDIISKFDPEQLHEDASSDRGAPIIGEDNAIDSGNGRVLTLNKIYEAHPELASKYRAMIESRGFSTEGMDRPVLVQRRVTEMTPEQRRQFVIDSNKDTKLELSPVERARSAADSITPEMLATYAGGDLNSTANAGFVQAFNKRLTAGEMGNMIGSDRRLTTTGAQRIENAVVANAYGNPKLLERMMESSHDDIRSITGSLADVAGPWARMRQAAKAGEIDASYDITDQLADAAARVSDARKRGIKPVDLLTQEDAFDRLHPVAAELIRAFHNTAMTRSASRKAVSTFLQDYLDTAQAQKAAPGLFGEEPMRSPLAITKELLEARDNPNGAGLEFDKEPTNDHTERRGTNVRQGRELDTGQGAGSPRLSDAPARASAATEGYDPRPADKAAEDRAAAEGAEGSEPARRESPRPGNGDGASAADRPSRAGIEADRGGYSPTFVEASFTNRQSVHDSAVRAMGLTPDKFNLLPPARKVKLLSDALLKLTGVRVEVAKQLPLQFAIDQLLDAHQTLQGMADVLGIAPRGISLGGALKLELVKSNRFLGAYSPGEKKIMLPGRSNSFGHEWGHALDYHLLDRLTAGDARGLTGLVRNDGADFHPENVRQAFVHVLNSMFFDGAGIAHKIMVLEQKIAATTNVKQQAAFQTQIDNILSGRSRASEKSRYWRGADKVNKAQGGGDYWTRPTEMFARAFEAWLGFKMDNEGFGTEFVNKGDEAYRSEADERFALTFPKGEERIAIFDALQKLMDTLNAEQIMAGGGTARAASGIDDAASQPVKAELAKTERKGRGLVHTLFGGDIEAWSIARENRRIDKLDAEKRAPEPVGRLAKINNERSLAFSAASDGVKMVAARWDSKSARAIHDHFAHDLGGTRRVDRVWGEAVTIRENKALNPVFKLVSEQGSKGWIYKKLDQGQRDTLRELLTGKDVADDMGLTPLASAMRKAFNDEWYHNQNAGIDLGYVKDAGYLNRQTDRALVAGQPDLFLDRATQVYELVFDRDVGEDGDAVASDPDKLSAFVSIAAKFRIDGLKALRTAIREDAGADEIAGLVDDMHEDARHAYATTAASEYRDAILHVETFSDYTATSTLPDSEKRRTLPAEADELLKDFYNQDPLSSLTIYVASSVRRTEWARRFGAKGEIAKKLDKGMAAEGVPESDRQYVWSLVDRMAERYRRTGFLANPGVANALGFLRVKGTLAMMGRAVTLSIFEPASLGIVTGNAKYSLPAIAKTWANVLSKGTRDEQMEWARAQGFIKHHLLEQMRSLDRLGTSSDTPSRLDHIPAAMFRNSGLTFLTDASDAAIVDVGRRGVLSDMAHRVDRGGKRGEEAERLMSELGVRDPKEFAKQIVEMNGAMPSDEWLNGPEGWDYNTALLRISRMTIQKPSPADLAPLGRNPLASYATYSITAFIQSSYRHLLKRNLKIGVRLAKAGEGELLARFTAGTLMGVVLLYGLNGLSSVAREYLFNPDRQDEWEAGDTWWQNNAALAASRTFSFGAFDPILNSATGLRYNRDLAYLPLGAYAGNDAQNATKVAKLFFNNSRKNSTAENNATQGAYSLFVAPTLSAGASMLPGGPFTSAAAGSFTAIATSPQASKAAGNAVFGEKGSPEAKQPTTFDRAMDAVAPKKKKAEDE